MNQTQIDWLTQCAAAALAAEHIFPDMAACEAALESAYGQSSLARMDNNLFGLKSRAHPVYGSVILPTKEFINSNWVEVDAAFVKYDTLQECFEDRMNTLNRLKSVYPHYANALAATDPVTYVFEVSQTWSTDPNRAAHVLEIYNAYTATKLTKT